MKLSLPLNTVNEVQPNSLLWQAHHSPHPVNLLDVRLLISHELNVDEAVILVASCQANIIGNGVLGSAKARHPPELARSSKFLAIPSSEIILDVKRTPPCRVWVIFSPSWGNSKRRIQAVQMPPSRTVIAWNDIPPVGYQIAAIADNQIVLAISKLLIVWFFDEACTVHLNLIVLRPRQTDLFVLASLASLDTLEILPNFEWQIEGFWVDLVDAAGYATHNSASLN
jgi:hypothetical protein